ncbi:MAG TPA: RHS repeat-associated core domain-containing protein [Leptospiraceae bacterium]|nr:RHS repeat-associated core domain-containing protein [Leptospiraceae bacterium]
MDVESRYCVGRDRGLGIKREFGTLASEFGVFFLHQDHLGSVTMVTDGAGNVVSGGSLGGKANYLYRPYGEIDRMNSSGPDITKYKYTGQEEDKESGLYYYKARYYDASLGRFNSADSLIMPESIQGMNRYMYVEGNPVKYNDPSGHSQERGWLGGLIHDLNIWNKNMQNDWHPWAKNLQKDYHKWNKKLLGNLSSWTTDLIHDNNRAFKKYLLHKTDYEVSPFGRSDLGRSGLGKSDLLQFFVKPLDRWNPGGDIGRSVGHWFYDKVSKPFWGDLSYDFFHYPWRAFRKSDYGRSDHGQMILRNQACLELTGHIVLLGYSIVTFDGPLLKHEIFAIGTYVDIAYKNYQIYSIANTLNKGNERSKYCAARSL